jgi:hypothetical protein
MARSADADVLPQSASRSLANRHGPACPNHLRQHLPRQVAQTTIVNQSSWPGMSGPPTPAPAAAGRTTNRHDDWEMTRLKSRRRRDQAQTAPSLLVQATLRQKSSTRWPWRGTSPGQEEPPPSHRPSASQRAKPQDPTLSRPPVRSGWPACKRPAPPHASSRSPSDAGKSSPSARSPSSPACERWCSPGSTR